MFYYIFASSTSTSYVTIANTTITENKASTPVEKPINVQTTIETPIKKRKYISTRDRVLKYMGYKR